MSHDPTDPTFLFLVSMTYMITADSDVDERELVSMYNVLKHTSDNPREDAAFAMRYGLQHPLDDFLADASQHLTGDQKLHILANLLEVLYADGVVAPEEMELFDQFCKGFQADEDEVLTLMRAAHIRHNHSVLQDG